MGSGARQSESARPGALAVMVGPFLSLLLLGWAVIGDASEAGGYTRPPVPLPNGLESTLLGLVGGLAVSAATAIALFRTHSAGRFDRVDLLLAAQQGAMGLVVAWCLRAAAATTVGANIGVGMAILLAPVLVLWSIFTWRWFLRSR